MNESDVLIVGGGVFGAALAWRLAAGGADVRVLDAGARRPSAAGAAAGMLAPSFEGEESPLRAALFAFGADSLAAWRTFAPDLARAAETDVDYRPEGVIAVAFTAGEVADLERRRAAMSAIGADIRPLSCAELAAAEPALAPNAAAGALAPADGQVDPRRVLPALRRAAAKAGARWLDGEARRLDHAGGRVAGVALDDGRVLRAGATVLASGALTAAWAPDLAGLYPVKGDAMALAAPSALLRRTVRAPGVYLCPKTDGSIFVGATERARETGLAPDAADLAALRAAGEQVAPALAGLRERTRWSGLRPATPDGAPILGPAPGAPGLVLALGAHRNGILYAPGAADALAAFLLHGRSSAPLDAFAPRAATSCADGR